MMGELCDGEVVLGERCFPVSRYALAVVSPFFKAAFTSTMREGITKSVVLDSSLEPTCVEALLSFAHSLKERIYIPEEHLESFASTSDQLGFHMMMPLVEKPLVNTLTTQNCLRRLMFAERHSLSELSSQSLIRSVFSFTELAQSPMFLTLPRDVLAKILGYEEHVVPEQSLFDGLVTWVEYDSARAASFATLFALLQPSLFGLQFIAKTVMYSPMVLASAEAKAIVQAALSSTTSRTGFARVRLSDITFSQACPAVDLLMHGKQVRRIGSPKWRGARTAALENNTLRWTLRISQTAQGAGFFLGIASMQTSVDDGQDSPKTEGKVGIRVIAPFVGDTFSFIAKRPLLKYSVTLVEGRSSLPDLDSLHGELPWSIDDDSWTPLVQMNTRHSVVDVVTTDSNSRPVDVQ